MTAHAAPQKEEHETEYQTEDGNHQQQGETCLAMDDVADGDARGDTELGCPKVKREVGYGHNFFTQAFGIVLHEPAKGQRGYQDNSQLLKDNEKGTPEVEPSPSFEQGEHSRNHEGGGKGGEHDESCHRINITADFRCYHRGSGSGRSYDAGEHALPENLLPEVALDTEDDPHVEHHEEHLSQQHAELPAVRAHLMEIHTTESGKKSTEHHHRKNRIDDGTEKIAGIIELRHPVEQKIHYRARSNGYR